MIRLERAVIVEGKYDKIKLSSILDALIITTDGFATFKDREKLELIRTLAKTRGIVILTDSDSAGFMIRSYLMGSIHDGNIVNAYIPDILGKEKRKTSPSKEGCLGVEGMEKKILIEALTKAGVFYDQASERNRLITKSDLHEDGFCGRPDSARKRADLLKFLSLPQRMSSNTLIQVLNSLYTFEEYKKIVNSHF